MNARMALGLAALGLAFGMCGSVWAQGHDEENPYGNMTPEQMKEMQAWTEAGTPGEKHQHLSYMVGEWDVSTKMWMMPESAPMEGTGHSSAEWVLDGRFVTYKYTGEWMGEKFEGRGYAGFDNVKKKYVSIWMDSMSTSIYTDEGTFDTATNTGTYTGEFLDPMHRTIKTRTTVKIVNDDKHTLTFYHTEPNKGEQKVMELTYTRAKKTAEADTQESDEESAKN